MEMRNRWFSHYLYGIDNGVEKDPRAMIVAENAARDAAPTAYADFPNPEAKNVQLFLGQGGNQVGALSLVKTTTATVEKIIDDVHYRGDA